MEIKLTLALPRDEVSVPVVRRVLKRSLDVLGIDADCVHDIEIALTEACTNVLDHATEGDEYEVSAGIDGRTCVIEVVDRGGGFDGSVKGLTEAEPHAEDGRGIRLMRQLLDKVEFQSRPSVGSVVHMEKELAYPPESAMARLTDDQPATHHGPWSDDERLEDAPSPRR